MSFLKKKKAHYDTTLVKFYFADGDFHGSSTNECLKHPVTSSCENVDSGKMGIQDDVETLELIWNRATRICESSSVKNFLQKRGKLVSVRLTQGNLHLIHLTHVLAFHFCKSSLVNFKEKLSIFPLA